MWREVAESELKGGGSHSGAVGLVALMDREKQEGGVPQRVALKRKSRLPAEMTFTVFIIRMAQADQHGCPPRAVSVARRVHTNKDQEMWVSQKGHQ